MTKRVGFFIAEGFQPLDLFGPLDTFEEANSFVKDSYQCEIISFTQGPVKASSKHQVIANYDLSQIDRLDYLVICGGSGMRQLSLTTEQLHTLKRLADSAQLVISICTGTFVLAQLYAAESLTVTTHWRHCDGLAKRYANCDVLPEPLFVKHNNIYSSAGILSGVDLSLAIVKQDLGAPVASSVAKELVVYLQRKGNQKQFSDMLQIQSGNSLRLNPVLEWMMANLEKTILLSDIAEKLCVSERQASRLFKQQLGQTPSQYLLQLRMYQARDLLSQSNRSLQEVARRVGFINYESFRRAFERCFGVSPSKHQTV